MELTQLDRLSMLDELNERSYQNDDGVMIFKHSARCGVSSWVWKNLQSDWEKDLDSPVYFLDLLKFRDISDRIAQSFGIRHESPQLIWIKNGQVGFHASHSAANFEQLKRRMIERT